jgi:hypothetical protein
MNMDHASGPRMPRIKKLVLRDPVGVPSSCCTIASERIDFCTRIRGFLARFSEPVRSVHAPSWADFITATPEFKLSVHLKGMITGKVLMIEPKGVNAFQWPNRLGIYMAANAKWVVAASHDERRFRCLKNENRSVDIGLGHCLREV